MGDSGYHPKRRSLTACSLLVVMLLAGCQAASQRCRLESAWRRVPLRELTWDEVQQYGLDQQDVDSGRIEKSLRELVTPVERTLSQGHYELDSDVRCFIGDTDGEKVAVVVGSFRHADSGHEYEWPAQVILLIHHGWIHPLGVHERNSGLVDNSVAMWRLGASAHSRIMLQEGVHLGFATGGSNPTAITVWDYDLARAEDASELVRISAPGHFAEDPVCVDVGTFGDRMIITATHPEDGRPQSGPLDRAVDWIEATSDNKDVYIEQVRIWCVRVALPIP